MLASATLLGRAFLKECLYLLFKGAFVHHACVRLGDLPVAVNEQGHWEGGESAVPAGEILVANHDWIIQLVLLEEWLYRFPAVVIHGNADGRESVVPVFILELHVPRNLNFAAAAPSSPEIEQNYFPFVRG